MAKTSFPFKVDYSVTDLSPIVISLEANCGYAEGLVFLAVMGCVERVRSTTNVVVERDHESEKPSCPNPAFQKRRRREYHTIVYGYQYNGFGTIQLDAYLL